jgi:hypothetical protein
MQMMFPLAVIATITALALPAQAEDLVFSLVNSSADDLNELYVSAADTDTWGDDILGRDVLASGESGEVTIADGRDTCDYDLRLVFSDGSEVEGNADLCETGSFTITD